jgi:hypothetical protein
MNGYAIRQGVLCGGAVKGRQYAKLLMEKNARSDKDVAQKVNDLLLN